MTLSLTHWRRSLSLVAAVLLGLSPAMAQDGGREAAKPTGPLSQEAAERLQMASPSTFLRAVEGDVFIPATVNLLAVLNESFTATTFPPPDWTTFGVDEVGSCPTASNWARGTVGTGATLNGSANSSFSPASCRAARYLVTPLLRPQAGSNVLRFKAAQGFGAVYNSVYRVMVSTTGRAAADFTTVAQWTETAVVTAPAGSTTAVFPVVSGNIPLNNTIPVQQIDLSAYNGQNIFVAFQHVNSDGDVFRLDDVTGVELAPPPPPDVTFRGAGVEFEYDTVVFPTAGTFYFVQRDTIGVRGNFGTLPLTSLTYDLSGTTNTADISEARLFYTGTSSAPPTSLAQTYGTAVTNPGSTVTFTGSQALAPGRHYVWLGFQIAPAAQSGNRLSAAFTNVTVGGTAYTPNPQTLGKFLTVGVRPPNNDLANAYRVLDGDYSWRQTTEGATRETNEALATCSSTATGAQANSIWWRYTPATDGLVTIDLGGSRTATNGVYDTVLSIHTGSTHPLTEVACNDDINAGGSIFYSRIQDFAVTAGTQYWIRVAGYGTNNNGVVDFQFSGPDPVQLYDVRQPFSVVLGADGQPRIGEQVRLKYKSDTGLLPDAGDTINVYLRRGMATPLLVYSGPNTGSLRFMLPADIQPGFDYQFFVQSVNNPDRFGATDRFAILDADRQFVFTGPMAGETWAFGSEQTITWTAPSGAPAGDVTLTLVNLDGTPVAGVAPIVTANTGSYTWTVPTVTPGAYMLRIVSNGDATYAGQSGIFSLLAIEVTQPAPNSEFVAGTTMGISFYAPTLDPTGEVTIYAVGTTDLQLYPIAYNVLLSEGTAVWNIPADLPEQRYTIYVVYRSPDGVKSKAKVKKVLITGGGPMVMPEATEHFARPVALAETGTSIALRAAGLADGSEVAAFVGERIVGTAVVRGGAAHLPIHAASLDARTAEALGAEAADAAIEVAEDASLRLVAFTNGVEVELDAVRVIDGITGEEAALAFADDQVLNVEVAAKGATAGEAAVTSLRGVAPNPLAGLGSVRFSVAETQAVRVDVYDLLGRRVATLFDGEAAAGTSVDVPVDASRFDAGVYVVRVLGASVSESTRFTVVR